jgi:flagellar protein FliO/FliZ
VIAVIYGVYWLLKTYSKSKKSGTEGDGKMDIVATTVLGPNRSMHLVRVGDELVLVGAAEQGVTPIRIYSAEEASQLGPQFEEPTDLRAVGGDAGKGGPTIARLIDDLRRRTAR